MHKLAKEPINGELLLHQFNRRHFAEKKASPKSKPLKLPEKVHGRLSRRRKAPLVREQLDPDASSLTSIIINKKEKLLRLRKLKGNFPPDLGRFRMPQPDAKPVDEIDAPIPARDLPLWTHDVLASDPLIAPPVSEERTVWCKDLFNWTASMKKTVTPKPKPKVTKAKLRFEAMKRMIAPPVGPSSFPEKFVTYEVFEAELPSKLRFFFNNPYYVELLYSLCHEKDKKFTVASKFEWLGDRVLNMVIAEWLFDLAQSSPELDSNGALHIFSSNFVSNRNNERVFAELGIEISLSSSRLGPADMIEIIIGCIFKDAGGGYSGFSAAKTFISRTYLKDFGSKFNHISQQVKRAKALDIARRNSRLVVNKIHVPWISSSQAAMMMARQAAEGTSETKSGVQSDASDESSNETAWSAKEEVDGKNPIVASSSGVASPPPTQHAKGVESKQQVNAKTEARFEVKAESDAPLATHSELQRKRESNLQAKPEAKAESKPQAKPESKPEAKPQAKPQTKPEAKPEVKPQSKPESKPQAKPESKPQWKPEAKAESKPETKSSTNPENIAVVIPKSEKKKESVGPYESTFIGPRTKQLAGSRGDSVKVAITRNLSDILKEPELKAASDAKLLTADETVPVKKKIAIPIVKRGRKKLGGVKIDLTPVEAATNATEKAHDPGNLISRLALRKSDASEPETEDRTRPFDAEHLHRSLTSFLKSQPPPKGRVKAPKIDNNNSNLSLHLSDAISQISNVVKNENAPKASGQAMRSNQRSSNKFLNNEVEIIENADQQQQVQQFLSFPSESPLHHDSSTRDMLQKMQRLWRATRRKNKGSQHPHNSTE